jgi:hypothetical protein
MSTYRYSKVSRRLWGDATFRALSAAEPNGQTLWLYLMTCPERTAIPGLFRAFEGGIANALGWSVEGFRKAWGEVSGEGLARADWRAGLVWIPKAIKHEPPESPNHVAGWRTAWDEMPECALLDEALEVLFAAVSSMGEPYVKALGKGLPKPYPKPSRTQEQEQEQEQEQDPPQSPPGGEAAPESARTSRPLPRPVAQSDGVFGMTAEAWREGIAEGRRANGDESPKVAPIDLRGQTDLSRLIAGHAPADVAGDDLLAWVRTTAAEFVQRNEARFGFTPSRCAVWCDAGRPDNRDQAGGKRGPIRQGVPKEGRQWSEG